MRTAKRRLKNDILYSFTFLGIAILAFLLFYRDLNATFSKTNENPIALVSLKTNDVQRHFRERLMWDQLRTEAPIYSGDVVRTANDSDLAITFTNGDELQLGANSFVQVNWTPDTGVEANVSSGTVSGTASSGKAMTINAGEKKIVVEAGASAKTAVKETGDVDVEVTKGKASVVNVTEGQETRQTVEEGQKVSVTEEAITEPEPIPPPPPPPPPEPLAAPANLRPQAAYRMTNAVLERSLGLQLSWDAVDGADTYTVSVWTDSIDRPLLSRQGISSTRIQIANMLSLLDIGTVAPSTPIRVNWQVSAEERSDTGGLLKGGHPAESYFIVDISAPGSTSIIRIETEGVNR
ncbi:MAG: FecR domain-containing protein [Spirochaetaceae bacterium]|jgi:hypothetical protein|nr:FecR domain-containing protein [Spirochaetaceae bacterium]